MFWRLTAQRLLVERQNTDVLPKLYKLANDSRRDALGMNPASLHALWTIAGLTDLSTDTEAYNVLKGGLYHPSEAVRKAAIQVLPKNETTDAAILNAKILSDRSPKVRMAGLLYFAERPASEPVGKALYEKAQDKMVTADQWLSKAFYAAASAHPNGFKAEYAKSDPGKDGSDTVNEKGKVIRIKTVQNEMKYDISEFVVEAGRQVELVLENVDFMQHNLVIVKPGQKEKVGEAADKLAADPQGAQQQYIPKMGEVLFATALVNPEQTVTLRFTAPSEAGEYPFICTFPGHWRIMQGVMKVVAN
jgi:azurin